MSDQARQVAAIVRETHARVSKTVWSLPQTSALLEESANRVKETLNRVERSRGNVERFRTLGCSTEAQRTYERSPAALAAKRFMQAPAGAAESSTRNSEQVEE